MPHVLAKIHNDDFIRSQLVKVIKNIASGPQNQVEYLVNHHVVNVMCKAFSFFKAYDEVLVTVCIPSSPRFLSHKYLPKDSLMLIFESPPSKHQNYVAIK